MLTTDTHVYFWFGEFSQWYNSVFKEGEISYCCAEQYMMAYKAMLFDDKETLARIMSTTNPKDMKALGRAVRNFRPDIWDKVRVNIVKRGSYLKFTQNERLCKLLKNTGTRTLVEASPYDTIWGVGLAEDDPLILDSKNWQGENLLGKALMHVRSRIYQEGI